MEYSTGVIFYLGDHIPQHNILNKLNTRAIRKYAPVEARHTPFKKYIDISHKTNHLGGTVD